MIEFSRFRRLKPEGVIRIEPYDGSDPSSSAGSEKGVYVVFKRFSHETGREEQIPERCFVSYEELRKKEAEFETGLVVIRELLEYEAK